jgi:hypothetical protein
VDLGQQVVARPVRFDEGMTHPFDTFADRRKVNRDFVGKRATELTVRGRLPFDGNPRVIDAPVLFHDWALA